MKIFIKYIFVLCILIISTNVTEACVQIPILTVSVKGPLSQISFRSISAALAEAHQQGACKVEINVGPGFFNELNFLTLEIPVVLRGADVNTTKTNLSLRNHLGVDLVISKMTFLGAPQAALIQSGGKLKLEQMSFVGTTRDANDLHTGTAILLKGGAKASFRMVSFLQNQSGAIYASEASTFYCGLCVFENNHVHPLALVGGATSIDIAAAVAIDKSANASIEISSFKNNEMAAIQIRGASAFVRNTLIESSVVVNRLGGIGMIVHEGSLAIGERVTIKNQPLVGLNLIASKITLKRSIIQNNLIGLSIRRMETGYDYYSCINDTKFIDNTRILDSDTIPVPPTTEPPLTSVLCPYWTFPI
jgi:hypothetical protein